MRAKLGLHTEEEIGRALNLVGDAYTRALNAFYESKDPIALAAEIGYIRGISDLAEDEGAQMLVRLARQNVELLTERLNQLVRRS